jgi:hypothetical protein
MMDGLLSFGVLLASAVIIFCMGVGLRGSVFWAARANRVLSAAFWVFWGTGAAFCGYRIAVAMFGNAHV